MRCVVELLDVDLSTLELYDCALVVVHVSVVWRRKYRDHHWEARLRVPLVHFIAFQLRFVRPDDRQQFVFILETLRLRRSQRRTINRGLRLFCTGSRSTRCRLRRGLTTGGRKTGLFLAVL